MNRWNRLVTMAVAHIRRHADAANVEIVFRYQNPEIGIDRVFNLQRNISETIGTTLNRIKTNIEKEHGKKAKKSKKSKKDNTTTDQPAEVTQGDVDLLIDRSESTTWLELLENVDDHNFKDTKLKVFGQEFVIAYNYPYVSQLTLPSVILADFDCYPAKFEVSFTERDKCQFEWFKGLPSESDSEIAWSKCESDGFFYCVQQSDLRHKLKVCVKTVGSSLRLV